MHKISLKDARRLLLLQQGLLKKGSFAKGEQGVVEAVTRLGYVQIDTISVVSRAHHHILWNRVPGYSIQKFDQAYHDAGRIYEHWGHAAAFLPTEHYRFSLPYKQMLQSGKKHWFKRDEKLMEKLLGIIEREGPKQSRDFAAPPEMKAGAWWDWKPSKKALEQLFMEGRLMIKARQGFQKIYDLPDNVLPPDINTDFPNELEWGMHFILRSIDAHGLSTLKQAYYQQTYAKAAILKAQQVLAEKGKIVPVDIQGSQNGTWYTRPEFLERPLRISRKRLHLLSPFDPVIIQRDRVADLFQFQYRLECYVPGPKRVYGYFTMPILWGDQFVGRLDAKADRKKGRFHVHQIWLEPGAEKKLDWVKPLADHLQAYAAFCQAEEIDIHSCTDLSVQHELRSALKN